ncbi:uncharacterized protein LOC110185786 [Drosophila serrata]|uniref:uncharacterized protein LOC110185786 n=1 Tax=Drosophila serrata TaxID=7274 RepID=UPI000A1D11B5|nr:uncharacterized protein LOC110185786 [Drosophila serrata]
MGLLSFWIFQVILSAALGAETGTHFHRYMLSDYKPQHSPKTQKDYKLHNPQRTLKEENGSQGIRKSKIYGKSKEPQVQLNKSLKMVNLHQLIVRIYQDNKYSCVGTQISELLVVTATTCFDESNTDLVNMKTYSNNIITGRRINPNETNVLSEDSLLAVILLNKPPHDSVLTNDSVQLCNSKLLNNANIEVPIWIRKRHSIYSWYARTLSVHECRYRLNDDRGEIAHNTMICVKNDRYTTTCQRTIGNPLIHNNMICGVNVAGHNCPMFTGIALYSTIYDKNEFEMNGINLIEKFDIEATIL